MLQALDGVRLEVAELRGGVEGLQMTTKGEALFAP